MTTQRWLFLLIATASFCSINIAKGQTLRDVVIFEDTIREFSGNGNSDDPNISHGLRIRMYDSIGKIWTIEYIKDNELNGDHFMFDPATNTLVSKGQYSAGKKNGVFYYWSKKGVLIKTEIWRMDKIVRRKLFSSTK